MINLVWIGGNEEIFHDRILRSGKKSAQRVASNLPTLEPEATFSLRSVHVKAGDAPHFLEPQILARLGPSGTSFDADRGGKDGQKTIGLQRPNNFQG